MKSSSIVQHPTLAVLSLTLSFLTHLHPSLSLSPPPPPKVGIFDVYQDLSCSVSGLEIDAFSDHLEGGMTFTSFIPIGFSNNECKLKVFYQDPDANPFFLETRPFLLLTAQDVGQCQAMQGEDGLFVTFDTWTVVC